MATPDPITLPCDYVMLGGKRTPGLAEVVGASSPRNWEERPGYAMAGAWLVFRGNKLAQFEVKLRFYSPEDFAEWDAFVPTVLRTPQGKRPTAIDIWHPFLEQLQIKAVAVEDVSQPVQTDDGEWTVTLKLKEFRRPKFALAKPESASTTPEDPVEKYIEALTKQVQELAAQ